MARTMQIDRETLREVKAALRSAEWSLQPFSDKVFNDNGDCTVTDTYDLSAQRFIDAHFSYKKARAALARLRKWREENE